MSSAKCCPFRLDLNVLTGMGVDNGTVNITNEFGIPYGHFLRYQQVIISIAITPVQNYSMPSISVA